jgi:ubiquitin-protein ligase
MASLALRRLQKEFSDFPRDNPNLQLLEDDEIQDLTRWKVRLVGAKDTIYGGEEFCLQVPLYYYDRIVTMQFTFTLNYPIESPEVAPIVFTRLAQARLGCVYGQYTCS